MDGDIDDVESDIVSSSDAAKESASALVNDGHSLGKLESAVVVVRIVPYLAAWLVSSKLKPENAVLSLGALESLVITLARAILSTLSLSRALIRSGERGGGIGGTSSCSSSKDIERRFWDWACSVLLLLRDPSGESARTVGRGSGGGQRGLDIGLDFPCEDKFGVLLAARPIVPL